MKKAEVNSEGFSEVEFTDIKCTDTKCADTNISASRSEDLGGLEFANINERPDKFVILSEAIRDKGEFSNLVKGKTKNIRAAVRMAYDLEIIPLIVDSVMLELNKLHQIGTEEDIRNLATIIELLPEEHTKEIVKKIYSYNSNMIDGIVKHIFQLFKHDVQVKLLKAIIENRKNVPIPYLPGVSDRKREILREILSVEKYKDPYAKLEEFNCYHHLINLNYSISEKNLKKFKEIIQSYPIILNVKEESLKSPLSYLNDRIGIGEECKENEETMSIYREMKNFILGHHLYEGANDILSKAQEEVGLKTNATKRPDRDNNVSCLFKLPNESPQEEKVNANPDAYGGPKKSR